MNSSRLLKTMGGVAIVFGALTIFSDLLGSDTNFSATPCVAPEGSAFG